MKKVKFTLQAINDLHHIEDKTYKVLEETDHPNDEGKKLYKLEGVTELIHEDHLKEALI